LNPRFANRHDSQFWEVRMGGQERSAVSRLHGLGLPFCIQEADAGRHGFSSLIFDPEPQNASGIPSGSQKTEQQKSQHDHHIPTPPRAASQIHSFEACYPIARWA
jgi:hypothetical protein